MIKQLVASILKQSHLSSKTENLLNIENNKMKYLLTNQETERLMFRKLENSDFEIWLKLFYDEKVSKLLGMADFKTPKERCEKWFEWTSNRYKNNLGGQNVLISKNSKKIIGQCGLLVRDIDNKFELEVAYSILPEFRNKGYAIESAKKCRDFAFENNFSESLISMIDTENTESEKVALKNGMKLERTIIDSNRKVNIFRIEKTIWDNEK